MRIQIRERNVEVTELLRAHVERRLAFALGRFGDRVGSVTVRFSDINGYRGGIDKRCQIDIDLRPSGDVRVEDTNADLFAAISHAADRASRSVARAFSREREVFPWPSRKAAR